jgi:hypothetical protein
MLQGVTKGEKMQLRIGKIFRFAVNKSTVKIQFDLGMMHFFSMMTMIPEVHTIGLSNLCTDNRLVFFADWDNVFEYRVLKELRMLQRKYDAGIFYLLCSGNEDRNRQNDSFGNYHAIGIGKWKYHDYYDVLEEISVDRNFARTRDFFNGKYSVLRVYPKLKDGRMIKDKPWLKKVLYAKTKRECNRPMYEFMKRYYGAESIPRKYVPRFDKFSRVRLVKYQTTQGSWVDKLKIWQKK